MRAGIGFDAHRFAPDRKLFLAGVQVPFERGLAGHSDADVALHALMDAMLGACGAGDIGEIFPDTDERFENASSLTLLGEVNRLVGERGFRVANADVVIICESPSVGPHRERMRREIARALGIDAGSVSVKGTTSEGMGFTGRGEGIASAAVVLLAETGE